MLLRPGTVDQPFDMPVVGRARSALPERDVLALVVRAFATLGDTTRAKLLYALTAGPLCVGDLALVTGVSESAVSHQLRMLRERRLVAAQRRSGNRIEYRLDDHHVAALFREAEYHADHVRRGLADHAYPPAE